MSDLDYETTIFTTWVLGNDRELAPHKRTLENGVELSRRAQARVVSVATAADAEHDAKDEAGATANRRADQLTADQTRRRITDHLRDLHDSLDLGAAGQPARS
jgi:hypothetical protein